MAEVNLDIAMESTSQQILSQMGQGVTAQCIKSIQIVDMTVKANGANNTVNINTVDPAKCLVVLETPSDETGGNHGYNYTLNSNSLNVTTKSGYGINLTFRFQIVEFY